MAFSSHVPNIYLDPPNLQQHHQQGNENPNQQVPSLHDPYHGTGPGSGTNIRPSSMADRARLAKIHHPEAALKCPRCDSSNTKFCYYNNYSLSQPRYFCKGCRRYWTKGGSLRTVPVGGGCRKNKKNKRSSTTSTSSESSLKQVGNNSNSKNSSVTLLPTENDQITGHLPHQTPHLPFMGSLQNLSQFGLGNLGLNFGGIQGDHIGETRQADMGFQTQQHHLQFPFFDPSNGLYPFQNEGIEGSSSIRVSQVAPVKMENKSRPENNIQYWGGNNWTNISGLNSSSSNNNHLL